MEPVFHGEEGVELERAAALLLACCREIEETEECPVSECSGRILAEDISAAFDQPPFDRSPVDGYACRSEDISCASHENPVFLTVLEEVDAGGWPSKEVGPGQAVRIMTGAPIPKGADCCIYQENTDYGESAVAVYESCRPHENYCFRGEDIEAGTLILGKNIRLSYIEAGILAGLGRKEVLVYRKAKAAVFASGDELMEPGDELKPGKIYDNNLCFLTTRLKELGASVVIAEKVPDDEGGMAKALLNAAGQVDMIITTGGVSVGKRDIMHKALQMAGARRLFWKILMKPGMPTIGSVLNGVPVVSLSGNPFGALADFELLNRPMLAKITRNPSLSARSDKAELTQGFPKFSPSRRFLRGHYEDGKVLVPEVKKHASGILSSMIGCNCLVDIPAGTKKIDPGEEVRIVKL